MGVHGSGRVRQGRRLAARRQAGGGGRAPEATAALKHLCRPFLNRWMDALLTDTKPPYPSWYW